MINITAINEEGENTSILKYRTYYFRSSNEVQVDYDHVSIPKWLIKDLENGVKT